MKETRYCVIWNDPETPISQVIRTGEPENITKLVLDLLIHGWGWTPEELTKRNENVHVFEITDETQTDPSVVGTIALFRDDGEAGNIFTDLIPIHIGETAKQALMRRATPLLSPDITFKMPPEIAAQTYGGEGTPLLLKKRTTGSLKFTVIGFVLFIDRGLAKALETFDLHRFWLEEPRDGFLWPTKVIQDFSAHVQALCEDHSIEAPGLLE